MTRSLLPRCRLGIILLSALATFTSCLESEHPVTDAKQGGRDAALCGAWKYKDKDGMLWTLQLGYLNGEFKSPWMGCTFATLDGTEHASSFLPCFVSRVAGVNYLNLAGEIDLTQNQIAEDASLFEKIHKYTILKYEIKDASLILTMVDEKFLKKAITTGSIKGEGTSVTASSADLASFLEKNHAQVFPAKEAVRFSPF
jgi:hypothetical protein